MDPVEIGTRRPRADAAEQVTGRLQFAGDMSLPGMLHARPFLSSEHHARILSIDTRAAEAVPGVRTVVTGRDVPNNVTGQVIQDVPVLPLDKVRYRGEMVALVVADTDEAAREAVGRMRVEYEPLPAVFDPRDAMKPGAPLVHEEGQGRFCDGNVVLIHGHDCFRLVHGDVEKGFAESDIIIEHDFATGAQKCAPIEPHVALARPESSDRLTLWSCSQAPHMHGASLARILGLPMNRVRMITPAVGGGFGQKNSMTIEPAVAVAALKTGRPVRLALTTSEDFTYSHTRNPMYSSIKLGAKADGTLMAIDRSHITNAGAYASIAFIVSDKCALIGSGPYRIPHQRAEARIVYTNKTTGGAMRGFGMAQPTFAMESIMDVLAARLGMDPLELRMKNVLNDGDINGTGQLMQGVGIGACLDMVSTMSGWRAKEG